MPGVGDVAADGEHVRLRVVGSIGPLIQALAAFEVLDVVSHEPSLEDVFLAFYGAGAADAG